MARACGASAAAAGNAADGAGAADGAETAEAAERPQPAVSLEACERLISALRLLDVAEPFNGPFADEEASASGYSAAVRAPVDLGLVEERLRARRYGSPEAFARDVRPRRAAFSPAVAPSRRRAVAPSRTRRR